MSALDRFMFALAMIGCACSLLGGNHTAAIANVAMALIWLYPEPIAHPDRMDGSK